MSWWDDLVDIGSQALSWYTGNTIGAQLARTAVTGYTLNQVTRAINREQSQDQQKTQDKGVRLQLDPDPNAKIPVVYGRASLGGIITDAALYNSNQSLYICFTICEQTGYLDLGAGAISDIIFRDIYWNNQRLIFQTSGTGAGIIVTKSIDDTGTENTDIAGLIQVFCYSGNSFYPVVPYGYTNAALNYANNIFPTWTANHDMTDLVFVIVRMDYNREKSLTSIGDWTFVVENTMKQPGDCLYDYMTNTRYGAGIDPAEIYLS